MTRSEFENNATARVYLKQLTAWCSEETTVPEAKGASA